MHELGIMYKVYDIAKQVSKLNNNAPVIAVNIDIGVMTGIIEKYAKQYFGVICLENGTPEIELNIKWLPAHFICDVCGKESVFDYPDTKFRCKHCNSERLHLTTGREFNIQSVTFLEED